MFSQKRDCPAGALNVIPGRGAVIGEKLVLDPRVKIITFTGSPAVGIAMRNKADLKRITLELGSNSALVIDQDYEITQALIERCVLGAFSFSGQVCISIQRIMIHESKLEEFLTKFKAQTEQLVIGDPPDELTDISALISEKDVKRMEEWVASAVARGAQIVTGGKAVNSRIYAPTILTDVNRDEPVSCQEVFGPIVTVASFTTLNEAIKDVNNSRFGLQAGI